MMHDERIPHLDLTLISRRYPPQIGGAEKVMSHYAAGFAEQGNRVTVLSSADAADGIPASRANPPDECLNPAVIRLPYLGIRMLGTAFYMRSLRRWLDSHRSDLVYVSMLKHDAFVATRWGKEAGVPVVLRPEGAGATGDMAWQRSDRFGTRIHRETLKADAYVALSERIRDELVESGYDSGRIHVIPNGVPIPELPWVPQDSRKQVATFVGRLAFEKGIDRLLAAWPRVSRACPGARLSLVGEGPETQSLRQLTNQLGIGEFVEFAGCRADVLENLTNSSVFVLPSREEGLSIALLEAMSLGLPVVVSDIPGNRTVVEAGVTGQIVDPDNSEDLANAITKSLRGESGILRMARAGRELVTNRYSVRTASLRHERLFRELIDRKRSSNS